MTAGPPGRLYATVILVPHLAVLVLAELLLAQRLGMDLREATRAGLWLHAGWLGLLLLHGALEMRQRRPLGRLLVALSLLPAMRILSVVMPLHDIPLPAYWVVVGIPVVGSVAIMAFALRLPPAGYGWAVPGPGRLWMHTLVVIASIAAGFYEAWLVPGDALPIAGAGLALALAGLLVAAVAEESLFRGLLARLGRDAIGAPLAVGLLAMAYGAMALGAARLEVAGLAFALGLLYGWVALDRDSLWPVLVGHIAQTVTVYLVGPRML